MMIAKLVGINEILKLAIFIIILSVIDALGVYTLIPLLGSDNKIFEEFNYFIETYIYFDHVMIWIAIFLAIISGVGRILLNYLVVSASENMRRMLATRALNNLGTLDLYLLKSYSRDDLSKIIITDIDNTHIYRLRPQLTMIAFGTSLCVIIFLLLLSDWLLTIIAGFALTGVYLLIYLFSKRKFRSLGQQQSRLNSKRYQLIDIFYDKFEKMKSIQVMWKLIQNFNQTGIELAEANTKNNMLSITPRYIIEVLVLVTVLFSLSLNNNTNQVFDYEKLSIFTIGFLKMLPLLQGIYHASANMRFGEASWKNVNNLQFSESHPELRRSPDRELLQYKVLGAKIKLKEQILLNEFELNLKRGKCYFVSGVSGAGKTTLLNALSLLESNFDCKYVDFMNNELSPRILYQTDKSRLLPMPLAENIEWYTGNMPSNSYIVSFLEALGFDKSLIQKIMKLDNIDKHLSAGQLQRLELMQSLQCDADILLLDEPFANLDQVNKKRALNHVVEYCNKHERLAVIVSHDTFENFNNQNVETIKIKNKNVIQKNY